ncbi:ATP synthase subunit O, mitochondrial [Drosophila sechellia]|uniref:Oligomycin sensitivity conferral protein n=4 Tax=melanogaster subgroup TaxID=32351 RepID=B4HDZ3_DROSE|nr:ATP synthase subunit O, mitochondrial [Drosophila sechellia]XP_002097773.1 ATP synthase subunit O, mitochondrial [Drosophila yakuba]XP_016034598.1 ATP synthase subunit O, mitochondrial [Drosophila simulans]XP_033162758.1 ATP synthase subunit O, mitochondrial [Drosophila mauritiana]XP_039491138.1 ATP synthase subunit O, mitochondrial [Drosophila santomea]XP_043655691.1 ATP synthase subunit O, mitochondrial [Drosophila teissieri]EDW42085.1 GM24212 [Drosophila sechellia]EDW97485.1 uncharacte
MASINKLAILSRTLSSAAAQATVKPPVQVFGLEGRYATALYSAASKLSQLDQVEKDLTALQATIRSDKKLREYVTSPIINKKVMATALKEASEKLRFAPATANLLGLLADNGRLKKLDTVINAYKTIMAAHRGEVVCEVVTAKPLDASQSKQLEGALKSFLKGNESLKITSRVDPSIIGGLIVSIGDKYVDMSIATKVKLYTDVIQTAA